MQLDPTVDALTRIRLFKGLGKETLGRYLAAGHCEVREYGKEQIIHLQNEECRTIDIVLSGRVAVQKIDENGNILTISVFTDRDLLGANLLFSSRNYYPMTVIAIARTTVLQIRKELVLELCRSNREFMIGLLGEISDKANVLAEKINAISLKTIRQQVLEFLEYEALLQRSLVVRLPFPKKEWAERLGVQRSSLSRELNKMRQDGLVEFDAKTITLLR
ncbi:Crp/Fnr family transcriptional regulator [Anaerotalea alkaliphila]|uniref:Crp/Fnr family transcriptional regulator n=1 Tax=Anaerotalea alkaliphila TaxID=2662126 RepID=A0A7X5HVN9_9FIRM|nr:Crp/Fnr family transcriptional regulator [Anaerotalea alkaliphila]NDL67494.1 Crp/Fnr family transcriptional regulator [Anaerotalea alkaliphila]